MNQRASCIEKREKNRSVNLEKSNKRAQRLVKKHVDFDLVAQSEDKQEVFNIMWEKFDNELKKHKSFRNYRSYVHGYNEAIRYCQDYIEDHDINVGFPKYIVVSDRPKSFRTESWFIDGQKILRFYINWMDDLTNKKQLVLEDLMLSIVFHSAVLKAPVLQTILNSVIDGSLNIESVFGLPSISIIVDDTTYHTNTIIDSKAVHQAQVFLSPLSVRLIDLYQQQPKSARKTNDIKVNDLHTSLRMQRSTSHAPLDMGLSKFLKGSIYVLEDYLGIDIPEHTWYLITGEEHTYSLPRDNWQSIIYNISHHTGMQYDLKSHTLNVSVNKIKKPNHSIAIEIAKLFKRKKGQKVSKSTFISDLKQLHQSLLSDSAPLNELSIVGWLLSKTDSCQVSSIQTYSNMITYRWLAVTENVDFYDCSTEDFEGIYNELIELGKTDKAKNTIAAHIDDIHRYMVNSFNIEPIAPLSSATRAHHKTGYISEIMFQAVLINAQNLEVTKDESEAIQLSLILGQRCGLRIGEIVKIRLRDVAQSLAYLEVRDNKYGNNKSSSALRRVLLNQLLTDSDMLLLKRVVIRRYQSTGDTLIASQAGRPYSSGDMSRILTDLIKGTTGLTYLTTHHLRHSCLTNFQLMSFLYDKSYCFDDFEHDSLQRLKNLLPYDEDKACALLNYIETSIQYKKIYALAGIAGHASPSTTFSSYVHLIYIELGLLLYHTDFMLQPEHCEMLGVPRRRKNELKNNPIALNDYFIKKIKLKPLKKPKIKNNFAETISVKHKKRKKYAFDDVRQVLNAYTQEGDYTHTELIDIFEIEQHVFDSWLNNAQHLRNHADFQTIHNKPRLFTSENSDHLLPTLDRFAEDRDLMKKMTSKFRDLYKVDDKYFIHQFVLYTLKNSQYHKNYINFNDSDILKSYLKIILNLIYKKDIRLKIYNYEQADSAEVKRWRSIIESFPKSQLDFIKKSSTQNIGVEYQKRIRVDLSLVSQTEQERIENRSESDLPISGWTVRTLQVFCHYVFIIIGDLIPDNQPQ
ncbi:tyrosine-type recombinase/integrase [Psychrobacter sp. H8-1]|uniref:tyrosine-type recombinase/integrase n=1 Tax=Psychrobacter sp. H8-1 TaxID=2774129 RepID=UPI00191944B4|nr:tyrosine-type recombinase/integrase [Psychrobacter sp. H8-1]